MGVKRNYGFNRQLERIANALEAQTGNVSAAVLDAAFCGAVNGENTTTLFRRWWKLAVDQIQRENGSGAEGEETETAIDRYALLCRWFTILADAWGDKIYTLRFADYRVGSSPEMTPMADLAGRTAAPCCTENDLDEFHWTDEDPMTWYIRFNGLSRADGSVDVTAIEGIDDDFDITGNAAPVWTGYTALWRIQFTDGTYEYKTWATRQGSGMRPYAADVAPDGTHRAMHWEATFGGSLVTKDGKTCLTSGAGNQIANRVAGTTGITYARNMGAYEGLYSDTDLDHLLDQWQMRHFNLENSGILEGCLNYNYQYTVAAVEEGEVKRVILTAAQAANLIPGSYVMIGAHPEGTANTDRNTAGNWELCPCGRIESMEEVEIDGTALVALNLDIETGIEIPATALVSTAPWAPGSTERIPGHKDGSLVSCTSGVSPARIAGVEVIDGAYAVGLDPLWNSDWNAERTPKSIYTVYQCRDATKQGGSVNANYEQVATFTGPNSNWQYIKHFAIRDDGMMIPEAVGGSSTIYVKSAFYFTASSGVRAPWRFCHLSNGEPGGLAGADGSSTPGVAYWSGRPRLSGSGKTRGEWAA